MMIALLQCYSKVVAGKTMINFSSVNLLKYFLH